MILYTDHSHSGCRAGFQPMSRLELYAFLLNIALRRLYLVLKQQGVILLSPGMYLFFLVLALFLGVSLVSSLANRIHIGTQGTSCA